MAEIPKFRLYGDDPNIERAILPTLALRRWGDLSLSEKQTAWNELRNNGWIGKYSKEILRTIEYLNFHYLRRCPGKYLHAIPPSENNYGTNNEAERMQAAVRDFEGILLGEKSDELVLTMLSKFVQQHIDSLDYQVATKADDESQRSQFISRAFRRADHLANCLNHIFEQFAVNQLVTRNGFVPRQDEKITTAIYSPTISVLADPKWKTVSDDLAKMFEDYREENYAEVITKAHSVLQRFLQVLVGEEGKSGQGELGKLFSKAKQDRIIPINRFTEPLVRVFEGFIPSERATNSTAKPAMKEASPSDALLVMNVLMVFLQFCLQNIKK